MSSNQVEGKITKLVGEWDDHTIVTWVYEGAYVIYFPSQEEGQYDVDIFRLLEDLLYKDISKYKFSNFIFWLKYGLKCNKININNFCSLRYT
jgi:hypothetical protein